MVSDQSKTNDILRIFSSCGGLEMQGLLQQGGLNLPLFLLQSLVQTDQP